jgi:type I restriction enzyme S subunit
MSKWKEVRLGDIGEIITGKTPPKKYENVLSNNKQNNIMFITPSDMNSNLKYIKFTERFVTNKGLKFVSNCQLPKEAICVSCIGSDLGKVYKIKEKAITNQQINSIIVLNDINSDYVYYYLLHIKDIFKRLAGGTATPILNKTNFSKIKLPLPPLSIQKKIADILSVIDEKIETLQNINETLEEMAKAIFKSWFVDFEIVQAKQSGKSDSEIAKEFGISEKIVRLFPSEFETSEIGKIPKGWGVAYLGERNFSEIISSGIKKFQGEKIYLATADVNNTQIINKEVKITNDNRPSRANMQPVHKSIWFAKMKDSRKLLMFDDYSDIDSYILSTGFAGIKTTNLSHNFLWTFIMNDDFEKQKNNLANGAVQIAINNQNIKKIHFIKPSEKLLQIFNKNTTSIFESIYFNTQQIQTLQELRDTLLPKLINAEIEVDELDIRGIE